MVNSSELALAAVALAAIPPASDRQTATAVVLHGNIHLAAILPAGILAATDGLFAALRLLIGIFCSHIEVNITPVLHLDRRSHPDRYNAGTPCRISPTSHPSSRRLVRNFPTCPGHCEVTSDLS